MTDPDPFSIAGRRILLTGATGGLGSALAASLLGWGAAVAVHGRDEARLAQVRDDLAGAAGTVVAVAGELRDEDVVAAVVDGAVEGLGGLDGVINCAGGSFRAPVDRISANGFNAVLQTNLTTAFLVAKAAFSHLAATGGAIVSLGSVAGMRPAPELVPYGAAKAALGHLTTSLAAEWSGSGVRVNAVVPGLIATDAALRNNFDDDPVRIDAARMLIGVQRLGEPGDIAAACRFLLSPASSFVNGAVLVVDGGPPPDYVV